MWDNINVIINKKRSSSNIEKLQVNDENFEQLFSISNAINKYFCGIQAELASKLPKSHHRSSSYEYRKKETFRLQNKAIRIINNVPIRDHVNPHYVGLGLIKLPDIIKLSTCQLFYDHIVDKKSSNFALSFVSEIHDYATRSTSLQHLNPSPFRINIRKLFSKVIGYYY
ncbi:hypothetical protein pdam_00005005 [Pocillopora damicornis]|uniref:Uncharacterized protein n=1 Tax=Pocillopora damicornis TaxID=46731 RepID=A0A3M6UWJ4_POCDA|nr:hypothetical protein pdam_00005005 [Pocillopora damicornis]